MGGVVRPSGHEVPVAKMKKKEAGLYPGGVQALSGQGLGAAGEKWCATNHASGWGIKSKTIQPTGFLV